MWMDAVSHPLKREGGPGLLVRVVLEGPEAVGALEDGFGRVRGDSEDCVEVDVLGLVEDLVVRRGAGRRRGRGAVAGAEGAVVVVARGAVARRLLAALAGFGADEPVAQVRPVAVVAEHVDEGVDRGTVELEERDGAAEARARVGRKEDQRRVDLGTAGARARKTLSPSCSPHLSLVSEVPLASEVPLVLGGVLSTDSSAYDS